MSPPKSDEVEVSRKEDHVFSPGSSQNRLASRYNHAWVGVLSVCDKESSSLRHPAASPYISSLSPSIFPILHQMRHTAYRSKTFISTTCLPLLLVARPTGGVEGHRSHSKGGSGRGVVWGPLWSPSMGYTLVCPNRMVELH